MQGNALFILKKAFLYLKNMPTCRDRRPRLSAIAQPDKPLPQAPLKEGMSPNGMPCRGKRADRRGRLSLLYSLTFLLLSERNNPTQPPRRRGVPNGSRLGKGILNTKRAFLHIEETPSLNGRKALLVSRKRPLQMKMMFCYQLLIE